MPNHRLAAAAAALSLALAPLAAHADLAVGTAAPDFSTTGALAGKPLPVSLKALLGKGPVVLYFYPKAFTPGCTLEAHAFAEASDDFTKAGAIVVGMSNRTSYVITPDGKIVYAHTDMDWHSHVEQTLAVVQKLSHQH